MVAVGRDVAESATIPASVLVSFESAREGLRDQLALELALGRTRWRLAGSDRKDIHKHEHKVSWEGTAQIRDAD